MEQIEIKISNNEINYEEAVLFMESRVDDIIKNKSQELLWFLNHNHIFTQGTSALKEEILNPNLIDVIKSNPLIERSIAMIKKINKKVKIKIITEFIKLSDIFWLLYFVIITLLGEISLLI